MSKSIVMAATVFAVFLSGCVAFYDSKAVVFEENDRVKVKFDSAATSKLFREKVIGAGNRKAFVEHSQSGMLGVYFYQSVTFHETAHYNHCVREVDYDGDGVIAANEMSAYLGSSE